MPSSRPRTTVAWVLCTITEVFIGKSNFLTQVQIDRVSLDFCKHHKTSSRLNIQTAITYIGIVVVDGLISDGSTKADDVFPILSGEN